MFPTTPIRSHASRSLPPTLGAGIKAAVAAAVCTVMGAAWIGTTQASHAAVSHAQQAMFGEPARMDVARTKEPASSCAAGQRADG